MIPKKCQCCKKVITTPVMTRTKYCTSCALTSHQHTVDLSKLKRRLLFKDGTIANLERELEDLKNEREAKR